MPTVDSIASTSTAASLTFSHDCCCVKDSALLKVYPSLIVNTTTSKNTIPPIRHLRRKTAMFSSETRYKPSLNASCTSCHPQKLLFDNVKRSPFIALIRRIDNFQKAVKFWIRQSSNSAVLSCPFSIISIRQTALILLLFIAKFCNTIESAQAATITTKSITPVFDENAIAVVTSDSPPASKADDGAMVMTDEALSSTRSTQSQWRFNPKLCNIYENEPLHSVMDRVCELCHDMYSHQNSNMRVECRADCFRNYSFKKCLSLFKPSRTVRSIPHLRSRRFHI